MATRLPRWSAHTEEPRVTVIEPEPLAELIMDAGLVSWLIRKVALVVPGSHGHHPAHAMTRHTFTERFGLKRSFLLKIATIRAGNLAMQVISVRSVASGVLVPAGEMAFVFEGLRLTRCFQSGLSSR